MHDRALHRPTRGASVAATLAALVAMVAVLLVAVPDAARAAAPTSGPPGEAGTRVDRADGGLVPSSRYFGGSRYDTASLIARDVADRADTVLLARGDSFPDSLAGAYLAGQLDAPVLLTPPGAVAPEVQAALADLRPDRILVLGGTAAVSDDVVAELAEDFEVQRVAGGNRYATSAAIAAAGTTVGSLPGTSGRAAILASGRNFPDALVAGAIAHDAAYPLLLTDPGVLPEETAASLRELGITDVVIVGGTAAVSAEVEDELERSGYRVQRRAGGDRVATALDIADLATEELGWDRATVHVATGRNFPDALALSPLAGGEPGIVLLTNGQAEVAADDALVGYLEGARCEVDRLVVAGGPAPVSLAVEATLRRAATPTDPCPDPDPSPSPTPSSTSSPTPTPSTTPSPTPTPTPSPTETPTDGDEVTTDAAAVRRPVGTLATITVRSRDVQGGPPADDEARVEVWRGRSGGQSDRLAPVETTVVALDGQGDGVHTYTGPDVAAVDTVVVCPTDVGATCATAAEGARFDPAGPFDVTPRDPDRSATVEVTWVGTAGGRTVTLSPGLQVRDAGADADVLLAVDDVTGGPDPSAPSVSVERWDVTTTPLLVDRFDVAPTAGRAEVTLAAPTVRRDERVIACIDVEGDGCATAAEVQPDGAGDLVSILWRVPGAPEAVDLSPSETVTGSSGTVPVRVTVTDAFGDEVPGSSAAVEQYRRDEGGFVRPVPPARIPTGDDVEVTGVEPSLWLVLGCLDPDLDGCGDADGPTVAVDPDEPVHRIATVVFADEDVPTRLDLDVVDPVHAVGTNASVEVEATNALGDRVGAGVTITLDVDRSAPPGTAGSPLASMTAQTDAEGVATFDLTSDTRADDLLVACAFPDVGGCRGLAPGEVVSNNGLVSWRVPGDADLIGTLPATARVPADASHPVLLQVSDAFGAPAVEGRPITEEVHRSTDGGATFARIATNLRTVGVDGERTVLLSGPGVPAVDVLLWCNESDCGDVGADGQVTAPPGAGVASVTWVVPTTPATVAFDVRDLTRATGTTVEVDVVVSGAFGDPVAGATLLVEVYRDGDEVPLPGPVLTTDGDGTAALSLTGPDASADDAVWVCVDEDDDGTCTDDQLTGDDPASAPLFVTWVEPGQPATLSIAPRRSSQHVETQLVVALGLRDATGLEVPGRDVRVQVLDIGSGPPDVVLDQVVVTDDDGVGTVVVDGPVAETRWAIAACTDSDDDGTCVVVQDGRLVRDPDEQVGARGIVRWEGLS